MQNKLHLKIMLLYFSCLVLSPGYADDTAIASADNDKANAEKKRELEQLGAEVDEAEAKLRQKIEAYNLKVEENQGIESNSTTAPLINENIKSVANGNSSSQKPTLEKVAAEIKEIKQRLGALEKGLKFSANVNNSGNVSLLPTTSPALPQYQQALQLLNNREFDKAKEAFLQIISLYPEDSYIPQSYFQLGKTQLELKNFSEAEKAFKECLERKLAHSLKLEATLGLAAALRGSNKKEEMETHIKNLRKEQLSPLQRQQLDNLTK